MESETLIPLVVIAAILSASVSIVAQYLQPPRRLLVYIFKPLTTLLILAVALLAGDVVTNAYARLIGLGLVLSLIGDVWLMLPADRFLQGLASFLLAYICYTFAFLSEGQAGGLSWPMLALAVVAAWILAYLWPGVPPQLKTPVTLYVVIIVVMAGLATGRASLRPTAHTELAAAGALLLVVSDSLLAVDRFRHPFRLAAGVVLGTYFLGQLLIALSA